MEHWQQVQAIAGSLGVPGAIKVIGRDPAQEAEPLWFPTSGYLETGRLGPVPVQSIEWIDLVSEVNVHRGRLLSPAIENKQNALVAALAEAGIPYELGGGSVRVLPPNSSCMDSPVNK
jgi:hypothetical protein